MMQVKMITTSYRPVELDGDTWAIVNLGTRTDGKVYAHLASTTRSRQQRNGAVPIQSGQWIDEAVVVELSK